MASSSKPRLRFQVFVCFRGFDVRYGFLSHLYAALDRMGMFIYKDIESSRKGGQISTALMEAIEQSHIAIIIFSEHFVDSSYCLSEVTRIMELRAQKELIMFPVFFKVEPSQVRHLTGRYGESMRKHEGRGIDLQILEGWKAALIEASNISGWDLSDRCEAALIKDIVRAISEVKRFDVFLNFRGKDVRENFIKRLHKALVQKDIKTFMDSENLMMGQDFPPALKDAIEQSRMYVVIFSENYAESWWCLKELVQILKWKNKREQWVLPIFYRVDRGEVKEQKQSYGKAWAKHEIEYGTRSVKKWREALSEAADLKGMHLGDGNEDDWITRIVEAIIENKGRDPHASVCSDGV